MALVELSNQATLRYTENGVIEATRVFRWDARSSWPPTSDPALPSLGSKHPMEEGIRARDISWSLDDSTWTATVSYSSMSGVGTLAPPSREIGKYRFGETFGVLEVEIPVFRKTFTAYPEPGTGQDTMKVTWETDKFIVKLPQSQFTIEIVDAPPSFSDRKAISDFVGTIFEFVQGTGWYQFCGADLQWLSDNMVRYVYRFASDPGSPSPLESMTNTTGPRAGSQFVGGVTPDGTASAGVDLLVPHHARPPFSRFVAFPQDDASLPPRFATLTVGKPAIPGPHPWRVLPGMGWVTL